MPYRFVITIPEESVVTIGDLTTVRGALFKAAAEFVDWEKLHAGDPEAISIEGRILLSIAGQVS